MAKGSSFEQALEQLEECVRQLETPDVPIEEALKLYETGVKAATRCRKALTSIETKLERLTLDQDNQPSTVPLDLTGSVHE
ncbi:MAG: exodeoxyribonuclease VII small subunit [Desulfuromonadaceae bacterium]|nr:exodeoxyribonuclease VII small subunit [Desulfuromonadaceae bacterium]